jgi:hypothetical protein
MPSHIFTEWLAYNEIDPLGGWRWEALGAQVMTLLANIYRKKGARPYTVKDFMPLWGETIEEDPAEKQQALLAKVEMLNALFKGEDLRPKPDGDVP